MEKWLFLIIAVISGVGVCRHTRLFTKEMRPDAFVYYTNLSNLLVWIYFTAAFLLSLFPDTAVGRLTLSPTVRLSVMMCILITMLIYHFLLSKTDREYNPEGFARADNLLVHYIVPALVVAEWLLFADKSSLSAVSAAVWIVLPLAYVTFSTIYGSRRTEPLYKTDSTYPYPFVDLERIGAKRFLLNCAGLLVIFFLLALAMVFIGGLISSIRPFAK